MSRQNGDIKKRKSLEDTHTTGMATMRCCELLVHSSGWGIDLERLHGNPRMAQLLSPQRDTQDTRGDKHQ